MKSGANYVILRRLDIDTSQVNKIVFAFKSMSALIKKEYPGDDVTEKDKLFSIKLYQEDTVALKGDVSVEAQINYKDGAVGKTAIDSIHISNSLFTEILPGNNPTGTNADDVTFEVVGDVIIGKIVGDVEPEVIENAVKDYLDKHPVTPYDDTVVKADIKDLQDNKQNAITSANKLDYSLLDNAPTIPTVPTKTSELTNDSNFVTTAYHDSTKQDVISDLATIRSGASLGATALQSVPSTYALKTDIPTVPTKVSQLTNDENFAKKSDIPSPYDDTKVKADISQINNSLSEKQDKLTAGANITISGNVISASGGGSGTTDYSALTNKPSINNVTLSGNKTLSQLGINNLSTSDVDSRVQTYWNSHKEELKGAKGDDYVITSADYDAIADVVLTKLPSAESEEF